MPGTVLVSGAGVAGSCFAWWLDRYGYAVTLVEQAPEPRSGGYVIDFWGLGYDVAEKMGVLDELRLHDLKVQEFRIVDRAGRRISGFNQGAVQKLIKGRGMSLPRSALFCSLRSGQGLNRSTVREQRDRPRRQPARRTRAVSRR